MTEESRRYVRLTRDVAIQESVSIHIPDNVLDDDAESYAQKYVWESEDYIPWEEDDTMRISEVFVTYNSMTDKGLIPQIKERACENEGPNLENAILIADCHHGVYCPQVALSNIKAMGADMSPEFSGDDSRNTMLTNVKTIESGPDDEWYWEAWASIEDSCQITYRGDIFRIYQDGDVWLVPESDR